jgi:hypothetical protein
MNYYLNAFNEMMRKRQENQMNGQDFGQGRTYASPSGPDALGLGPAQDRSAFRDAMRDMPRGVSLALGMVPGIGKAFSLARAADYLMGKESEARNAPANQRMSEARQAFRTSEIVDRNAPMQNTPQQSFRTGELSDMNAAMQNTPQQAFQLGEKSYAPTVPQTNNFFASLLNGVLPSSNVTLNPVQVEDREATPNPYTGENPALSSTGSGFAGADIGSGGGFTGGVATGDSGGSPADAANLGYNQGGMVTPERLMGRAPAPDDGYGALQGGEYVITKAAVEKYGKRMMDAINNGTFR